MMNVEYSSSSGPSYTDLLPQASGKTRKYRNRYQIDKRKKTETSKLKILSLGFIHFLGLLLHDKHRTVSDSNSRRSSSLSFAALLVGTKSVPCPFPPPCLIRQGKQGPGLILCWTGNAFISITTSRTSRTHFENSATALTLSPCCWLGLHKVKHSLVRRTGCIPEQHIQHCASDWIQNNHRLK